MDLEEQFKEDLHGGKQIQGMLRTNGYYLKQENDGSNHIYFDNGNFYILKDQEVIKRIEGTDEFFIDRQIIKVIYSFIDAHPLMTNDFVYTESNYDDVIEFYTQMKKEIEKQRGLLIKIIINRENRSIAISNILIPRELKYNSFGKNILKEVFRVAEQHNYKLYLVQMVESFYGKMTKRGAKIIFPYDVVEVTGNTNLD